MKFEMTPAQPPALERVAFGTLGNGAFFCHPNTGTFNVKLDVDLIREAVLPDEPIRCNAVDLNGIGAALR